MDTQAALIRRTQLRLQPTAPGRSVISGWLIPRNGLENPVLRWSLIAALVAAWPGLPLVVERRLLVPGSHDLADELLLVSIEHGGLLTDLSHLQRDIDCMFEPVLDGTRALRLSAAGLVVRARLRDVPGDIAELRSVEDSEPGRSGCEVALQCLLDCLGSTSAHATVSMLLASPGFDTAERDLRPAQSLLAEALLDDRLPVVTARQTLRFCLRLTSDTRLSDAALAHAGAFAGMGPNAWWRARGAEVHAAGCAARGANLSTWAVGPQPAHDTGAVWAVALASVRARGAAPVDTAR
jgi:hypothetical protein